MQDWSPSELKSSLDSGSRVFLKLWQKGCGPCRMSVPAVERVEAADKHGLVYAQICIDDHPEMMEMADSEVLPVFFVFRDRQMTGKFAGFKGLAKLEAFIAESLEG